MAPGYFSSLALIRRTFAADPLPTRTHALGRFLTCPFLRVLPHLPPGARVLDLGAGHGTFARLAVEAGAAQVVAIEPDLRKALPSFDHPRIQFVAGYADAVSGTFDAVSIFDVLCRVPVGVWDSILATAFERLRPGGLFLLKEIDPAHRLKAGWNRTQERIADLLGMTLGDAFSYETREQMRDHLERHGFERFEAVEMGTGYPHAHILYKARRPAPH
jgi:SAM-dependent methyltransferase